MFGFITKKDGKMYCPICKCILGNGYNQCVNYCHNCGVRLFDKHYEDLKENKDVIGKKCYVIYGRKLVETNIISESSKYYSVKIGNGIRNYLKEKVIFKDSNQK